MVVRLCNVGDFWFFCFRGDSGNIETIFSLSGLFWSWVDNWSYSQSMERNISYFQLLQTSIVVIQVVLQFLAGLVLFIILVLPILNLERQQHRNVIELTETYFIHQFGGSRTLEEVWSSLDLTSWSCVSWRLQRFQWSRVVCVCALDACFLFCIVLQTQEAINRILWDQHTNAWGFSFSSNGNELLQDR